ncbi:hypothetical protein C0583_01810 [Candidatus Parcubacteria bacterium]|nr:MAG: hypothetical protein C0583_01810 [Candidatus Parcubacteria bacterium]
MANKKNHTVFEIETKNITRKRAEIIGITLKNIHAETSIIDILIKYILEFIANKGKVLKIIPNNKRSLIIESIVLEDDLFFQNFHLDLQTKSITSLEQKSVSKTHKPIKGIIIWEYLESQIVSKLAKPTKKDVEWNSNK